MLHVMGYSMLQSHRAATGPECSGLRIMLCLLTWTCDCFISAETESGLLCMLTNLVEEEEEKKISFIDVFSWIIRHSECQSGL